MDGLRQERPRLGLTIEEATCEMGVLAALLEAWELGESEPLESDFVTMSHFYGCLPDYCWELQRVATLNLLR